MTAAWHRYCMVSRIPIRRPALTSSSQASADGFDPHGEAVRREVLGDAAMDTALANMTPFDREYQQFVTNQIFGRTWGRGILSRQQLSLLNLGMLAGKGCMAEFEMHFRTALLVTKLPVVQLREALLHIGMYCGIPIARDAFVIARRVLKEAGIDVSQLDGAADTAAAEHARADGKP
jgi:4-carboxymuconolactone decarboxylase